MSVLKVVEACELTNTFIELGYLFRAKVCLNIALENLYLLRSKTNNIAQVETMLTRKTNECLRLEQRVNSKIEQRKLIKIRAL
ncbi:cyun33 [Cyclophragma undans nucleopolyhedrovirus]|uniref:Cyun33 n=1 Tax=Cyclophragma undans nucleopolyhedrovirus TaxID=1906244 RepID=A0A288QD04_9ABAC|nr:cyun33 [Cyclophragma undans nucleopolyhedrovirus]AOT85503.1 cyun33 [Cyclophragma undans nucleopolyhedrovirus]